MKNFKVELAVYCRRQWLWLILIAAITGADDLRADAAVQYHCAGMARLRSDPHLLTLQKVLALPKTTNLEELAQIRFCALLTNSLPIGNNPSNAALIGPLLSDVVEDESLGKFGGASANGTGFILAVRLSPQRTKLWQDNFSKVLGGDGEKFSSLEYSGLRWKTGGSNPIWIIPARDWLLAGCGDDFSAAQMEYLNQIKAKGRPVPALDGNWLEGEINSSRVGGWFRCLRPANIKIAVKPDEDNLQIEARILEAGAIPWNSGPWQIPKDLMQGQIISFSAGQDVAAFLRLSPGLSHLDSNPLTNQFCFWSLDQMPMLNYLAWPADNASNALRSLAADAPTVLNPELKRFNGTELSWYPGSGKLVWQNMRLFTPAFQAVQAKDGQFLLMSGFPRSNKSKPVSDALLGQVEGHTNLVYYDWELTGRRLQVWQILSKMISNRSSLQSNDANYKAGVESGWLEPASRLVGNTVTEVTHVAANELSIMRKAPVGFTALELVLLADWFCDANSGPIHTAPPAGRQAPPPAIGK